MKKILIFIMAVLLSHKAFSKVYRFRASALSTKITVDNSPDEWSEWKPADVLVTFDMDQERVTIYSKLKQIYDITKTYDKKTDSYGNMIFAFDCIDSQQTDCYIYWMKLKDGGLQIYVEYEHLLWVYNVELIT